VTKPARGLHAGLIAAYRRGMGLAAIAIVSDAGGLRLITAGPDDDTAALARWWCRRPGDAERVVATASQHLRRRDSRDPDNSPAPPRGSQAADESLHLAVATAARVLNVELYSDEEIVPAAMAAAERIDSEVERMQRRGELRSVNKSYQTYRLEATARGEKVMRYQDWMRQYKENLLCKLAATLRQL
jgi:hypothetical protein